MNPLSSHASRRARRAVAAALVAGTGLAGALAGAGAAHATTDGFVTTVSCTTVAGRISFTPGLRRVVSRSTQAVLAGATAGCATIAGAIPGTGTLKAVLSGTGNLATENLSGTFTMTWPAGSNVNPSTGTLHVITSNGAEMVTGLITGGAFTNSPISFAYLPTLNTGLGTRLHPVTAQQFINTQPLLIRHNNG
jgi:hypothetical protein